MKPLNFALIFVAVALGISVVRAVADGSGDPKVVREDNNKYFDKNDTPTFKIDSDGTVDWYTYSGFRRYHSDCHVCHGPDGEGSTYAPGLKDVLKSVSYGDFVGAIASGVKNVNTAAEKVMPAFAPIRMSCVISTIFLSTCVRAPTMPSRVGAPRSVLRSRKRQKRPKLNAWVPR